MSARFSSVTRSCLTLWHHGLQNTRFACPSSTPRACSNSYLSNQWCHPTISSSVIHFSSCRQLFPAAGSFPVSQFFTLGGKSIGASVSALVILMNIQVWFLLRLIILISLQSKELSRVFSNNTVEKYQFFFWDFSEVLHFRLFCWQWGLFHLF